MKKDIHPKVHTDSVVVCVCGNTFATISTLPEIKVDICSACHPFFTGDQKFVDTEGRIDKFEKRRKIAAERKKAADEKKAAKKPVKAKVSKGGRSIREILDELKKEEKKVRP